MVDGSEKWRCGVAAKWGRRHESADRHTRFYRRCGRAAGRAWRRQQLGRTIFARFLHPATHPHPHRPGLDHERRKISGYLVAAAAQDLDEGVSGRDRPQ